MKQFWLIIFFITTMAHGQADIPLDYFGPPVDIPMILSGNFGELRANHFHSGLDIKTLQKEGLAIYASADGFVSRINVSHFGYGKALYLLHPNGYTTVYAHLQSYSGNIQKYVKEQQYEKETYEIELFPDKDLLPVKKGDLIAYSGNTGGSGGPHLHFEIRDQSQRPMNPMLFGIDIPDNKIPVISGVYAYPIGEDAQINQSQELTKLRLIKQNDGSYKTEDFTAFGKIGFGISAYDQLDGAYNKNGVYGIRTFLNTTPKFEVRFDKFSFSETRYLNRYTDYGYYKKNRTDIQKLFRESNNPLSVIVDEDDNGYIYVKDSLDYSYRIIVSDFKGNNISIIIPIKGRKSELLTPRKKVEYIDHISESTAVSISKGKFNVYFPPHSLYEDTYLNIAVKGDTLHLHEDIIPIHKNLTITADISNYSDDHKESLFIGRLNYKGKPYYTTTHRKDDKLIANTRLFGDYAIVSDTVEPIIKPINFSDGKWISNQKELKIKITDDLSGIKSYRATINGKFILMEYEYKNDTLTFDLNDLVSGETENNLRLIVIDNVGNSATFDAKFFRKQT